MKKLVLFILFSAIFISKILSQSADSNFNPNKAGEESSISESSNTSGNVNLSTGTVSFSLPLMKLEGGNQAGLNVVLNYNIGKGMKVNNISENVGTGFELNVGGYIKRTIRGIKDETDSPFSKGFIFYGDKVPFYRDINSQQTMVNTASYYNHVYNEDRGSSSIKYDGEPDIFEFVCGPYSGTFVFGNDHLPVLIPYQDIRIEFPIEFDALGASYTNYWLITTPDGTSYKFENNSDFIETKDYEYFDLYSHHNAIIPSTYKWNVSSITSSNNVSISFVYADENRIDINAFVDYEMLDNSGHSYGPTTIDETYSMVPKRLVRVISDFGELQFIESTFSRPDFSQNFALGEIRKINQNNNIEEIVRFSYEDPAFPCNSCDRFFLRKVDFQSLNSPDEKLTYSFNYNESALPVFNSTEQDFWGFWNSNTSGSLIPSCGPFPNNTDRNPDPSRTSAGMLQKVIFPQGGSKEFFL